MTSDIVAFLEARIAEDQEIAEQAAQQTADAGWAVNEYDMGEGLVRAANAPVGYDWEHEVVRSDYAQMALPVARHIARWDPARVLAECAAKRRIIDSTFHAAELLDYERCCHTAAEIRAGECLSLPLYWLNENLPFLAALAAPYAAPDFDPGWVV